MKRILLIVAVFAIGLVMENSLQAQTILPFGAPFSDPNNAVQLGVVPSGTRNNIGHLESGDYGIINSNTAKWLGLGSAPAGAGPVAVYGKRIQWGQNFAVFNLRETSNANDKDLAIQWGGTNANSQLFFEFANSPFSPGTRVMQLESNGNVGIGATPGAADKLRVNGRIRFGSVEWFEDGGPNTTRTNGNFIPNITHRWDLGNRRFRWRNLYLSGRVFRTFKRGFVRNVRAVPYGISTIMQLNPISFQVEETSDLGLDPAELQNVIREAVIDPSTVQEFDEDGKALAPTGEKSELGINYEALIPVIIKAMQDQQKLIDEQTQVIQQMKVQMAALIPDTKGRPAPTGATLEGDESQAEVMQNAPNPFNQESAIDFFLPSTVGDATLYIYNMNGQVIEKSALSDRGSGSYKINANTLSPGIYLYTIVADGQDLGVKKMIVEN